MSIYEARPTLIDSDTEISATVEQTELDGVCVFLRLRDGLNDVHTVTLQAGDWTMFSQAVGDMIDRRINQGAAERSEPKKGKVKP